MKTSGFIETRSRFCSNPIPVSLTNVYVGEIDTYEDLIQARNCCHLYSQSGFIDTSDLHTIIIDFDGVLTDNKVITSSDGKELIQTSKYDSLALSLLKKYYSIFILHQKSQQLICIDQKLE